MKSDRVVAAFPAQINSLTSLRFVAALWVVLFHVRELFGVTVLRGAGLVDLGYLGVDFFFILSGFILAHVYLVKVETRTFDFWGFIVRRFARVYPMHVLTLAAFIAIGVSSAGAAYSSGPWDLAEFLSLERGQLIRSIFVQLTLIHAWGADQALHFNLPSWSISAEWFAYSLFPVVILVTKRRTGLKAGLLGLVLILANLIFDRLGMPALTSITWNIGALRIIPEFSLGVCLYMLGRGVSLGPRLSSLGVAASIIAIVALGSLKSWAIVPEALVSAFVVLGLGMLIFCVADLERSRRVPLLSSELAVLLGEISYSVYMLHFGISIAAANFIFDGSALVGVEALAAMAALIAVITLLSYLTWRFVELPSRRIILVLSVPKSKGIPA